jgi:hypothetical protein
MECPPPLDPTGFWERGVQVMWRSSEQGWANIRMGSVQSLSHKRLVPHFVPAERLRTQNKGKGNLQNERALKRISRCDS